MVQQPGLAVARIDVSLDPDDGGDVGMPVGVAEFVGGVEDGDAAAFVAVASGVVAMVGPDRGCGGGDVLDPLVQRRLIVLDLNDQGNIGFLGDLEVFF
jgi:hypothetical protein